jgi:hypothetical protein
MAYVRGSGEAAPDGALSRSRCCRGRSWRGRARRRRGPADSCRFGARRDAAKLVAHRRLPQILHTFGNKSSASPLSCVDSVGSAEGAR